MVPESRYGQKPHTAISSPSEQWLEPLPLGAQAGRSPGRWSSRGRGRQVELQRTGPGVRTSQPSAQAGALLSPLARPMGQGADPLSPPALGCHRKRDCPEPSPAGSSACRGPVRTAPGPEGCQPGMSRGRHHGYTDVSLKVHKMAFLEQQ